MKIEFCYLGLLLINNFIYGILCDEYEGADNELYSAIEKNKQDLFVDYIESGKPINIINIFGWDPLYASVWYNRDFMCNYLLNKGFNMHVKLANNDTSFKAAMLSGDDKIHEIFRLHILKQYESEYNPMHETRYLIISIIRNDMRIFNALIPAYEEFSLNTNYYNSSEEEIITARNLALNKRIVGQYGSLLRIALLYSIRERNYKAVERLIQYGVHEAL